LQVAHSLVATALHRRQIPSAQKSRSRSTSTSSSSHRQTHAVSLSSKMYARLQRKESSSVQWWCQANPMRTVETFFYRCNDMSLRRT
jgi:hypothetical protein